MTDAKLFPRPYVLNLGYVVIEALCSRNIFAMLTGELRRGLSKVSGVAVIAHCEAEHFISIAETRAKEYGISFEARKKNKFLIHDVPGIMYSCNMWNGGSMMMATTGNRFFNILLRARAKSVGYKLSQYGLYCNDEIIAGKSEDQIFYALNVPFVSPLNRNYKVGDVLPERRSDNETIAI